MIDIILMVQSSEVNKIGKTKTTLLTANGVLKEGTSIIDPVFNLQLSEIAARANYIHVPAFNRYYFIREVISVRNGIYDMHCHVDVLDSWEAQIKANAAVIQRQEKFWNLYLNDGQFKVYQNPNITTQAFPHGFHEQTPCFALAVAGGEAQSGGGGGGGGGI